jgi:hypothetical protein
MAVGVVLFSDQQDVDTVEFVELGAGRGAGRQSASHESEEQAHPAILSGARAAPLAGQRGMARLLRQWTISGFCASSA